MDDILKKMLARGIEMHVAGDFELASQLYCSVIKLQPNNADANYNMGLLKIDKINDMEALHYLQIVFTENTRTDKFWLSYLSALIRLEQVEDAVRIFGLAKERGINGGAFHDLEKGGRFYERRRFC
jgi:hypothetical protein